MDVIEQVFADARRNFIYTPDDDQFGREDWRSHADEIDKPWRDDCDGFAMTCADLAVEIGIPKERVRVALCSTEVGRRLKPSPLADHAVCLIDTENGTFALDNRQRRVEPWDRLGYVFVKSRRLSAPRGPDGQLIWRDMTGTAPVEIARPVAPVAPAT